MVGYLNQKALYAPFGTADKYGDVTSGITKLIACRKEPCVKLIQTTHGELYQTTARYFLDVTAEPTAWKDRLDGRVVAQVDSMVDMLGNTIGYEVLV